MIAEKHQQLLECERLAVVIMLTKKGTGTVCGTPFKFPGDVKRVRRGVELQSYVPVW